MAFTLEVHQPIHKDGEVIGIRATPYARLCQGDEKVIIQAGEFYGQGGDPIDEDDVPEWVFDAIDKMSLAAQQDLKVKARPKAVVKKA